MTLEQALVYAVIIVTLAMLAFEIWRYDLAALIGMMLLVLLGIINVEEAFTGFDHPAVLTIAAVLVVSRGLQNTGVADLVARWMTRVGDNLALQLIVLCTLIVFSSAFMNNIAALAIFIPVAVRLALKSGRSTSLYLLPMAFSSHFGGLITLIGTPTNLIISSLRLEHIGERYGMFAFASVGLVTGLFSILFMALVGWRLIPRRKGRAGTDEEYEMADYLTQIVVSPGSKLVDLQLQDLSTVTDAHIWIVTILRDDTRISTPVGSDRLQTDDVLLVQAEASEIRQLIYDTGVELTEAKPIEEDNGGVEKQQPSNLWEGLKARINAEDIDTIEAVVSPDSPMVGKTARELDLRARYEVNLLAISRCNANLNRPVGSTPLQAGDVLLLQTHHEHLSDALHDLGVLPLAERELNLEPRNLILGLGIFVAALVVASLNILPVPAAMMTAAIAMVISGVVTLREAYRNVEWPIVVLLGSMFSLEVALAQTGGDQLIADQILRASAFASPTVLLVTILLVTMMLSNVVNNVAAVVLMASIAVNVARGLGVALDPFLVAVAVGGAMAFLTPVGHEANVLVFNIGGYKFGDYWRLGLPIQLLVTVITIPILLLLWPF